MQWGNFFGTVTHGLSINTVSLDCDFHWKDATHKIDLGLSYGVQNGVLRRNNRILQKVQFSIVSPNQSTIEFIVLQRFVHNWPRVVSPPSQPICQSKGNGKTISNRNLGSHVFCAWSRLRVFILSSDWLFMVFPFFWLIFVLKANWKTLHYEPADLTGNK